MLIKFDRKHISLLAFLSILFFLLIALHLHGFSITAWHDLIDQSPHRETLLGKARGIRSDDFLGLTFDLSQFNHDPPFPVFNRHIGQGQNMLLLDVAVRHWVTLFRPQTWGFFFGEDFGLAWNWWFNFIGLFYSSFLVFLLISRNRIFISIFASLILLFSPFFQFWSLNAAPLVIFVALSFIFSVYVLFSKSSPVIILCGVFLGWSVTGFVLRLYPPYIITLFYLLLFLFVGFVWRERKEGWKFSKMSLRIFGLTISIGIVVISLWQFLQATKVPWELISGTVYPGRRLAVGGTFPVAYFFSNLFIPFPFVTNWSPFVNICEASSFIYFFPLVGAAIGWQTLQDRKKFDPLSWAIIFYIGIFLVWVFKGFPPIVRDILLLNRVPEGRTVIGFGIANLALLVSFLSKSNAQEKSQKNWWMVTVLCGLWLIFLFFLGSRLRSLLPEMGDFKIFSFAFLMTFLGYALLNYPKIFMVLLATVSIYSSAWFNPLVRGGVSFIQGNPLSKKIVELDDEEKNNSTWIVLGQSGLPNLLRAIGVRALNGIHYHPHFEIWKKIDPQGVYSDIYNRYAHVFFTISDKAQEAQFSNPAADSVKVTFNPGLMDFQALGVDFLVNIGDSHLLDQSPALSRIYTFQDKQIYRVKK